MIAPALANDRQFKKTRLGTPAGRLDILSVELDEELDEDVYGLPENDVLAVADEQGNVKSRGLASCGLERVARSYAPSHTQDIRSIRRSAAESRLAVRDNLSATDSRLPGATLDTTKPHQEEITAYLIATYTQRGDDSDFVTRHCDYAGLTALWSPGPFTDSLEAIYPFVLSHGRLAYHASNNVALITTVLNLGKRQHPALSLAIIATWVNALNHGDFKTSRAEMCWAFNAAINMAIARQVFHCFGYHKDQIQDWATWDIMKQSEVLDALRTGSLTAKLRCEVAARGQASLFKIVSRGLSVQSGIDYANMLETMVRIAAKYSLTPEEFEYYCCIDSPYDTRVFYPFHVLSRSQAKAIGWSWDLLTAFASERLTRMRTQCNKLAEEAGCGEKVVTDVYLTCWMAHWICQKIQTVKKQRPDASQDEIAFRLGDRWGLPVVPWMHHIWCASLCKLQDLSHSLAAVCLVR